MGARSTTLTHHAHYLPLEKLKLEKQRSWSLGRVFGGVEGRDYVMSLHPPPF